MSTDFFENQILKFKLLMKTPCLHSGDTIENILSAFA